MNPCIVVLVATRMEIEPFLEQAEVKNELLSSVKRPMIHVQVAGHNIMVVITGPGMVNTAQALTEAMERFKPDLVLQTGIAGVFGRAGIGVGDIGIADSETYVHTGIEKSGADERPSPLPFDLVKGFPMTRLGQFYPDPTLAARALRILKNGFSQDQCRVVKGPFITVSTITATDATAEKLFSAYAPCMEAMEGAASAQVAALYKVDFMEIRGGSNRVGQRDKTEWNIPLGAKRASRGVFLFLKNGVNFEH